MSVLCVRHDDGASDGAVDVDDVGEAVALAVGDEGRDDDGVRS
jgi:hypothetical protein